MPLPPPEPDISDSDDEDAEVLPDPGHGKRVKGVHYHTKKWGDVRKWIGHRFVHDGPVLQSKHDGVLWNKEIRKWRGLVCDPTQRVGKRSKTLHTKYLDDEDACFAAVQALRAEVEARKAIVLHELAQQCEYTRDLPLRPTNAADAQPKTAYYGAAVYAAKGAAVKEFRPTRYVRTSNGAQGFVFTACCQHGIGSAEACTNVAIANFNGGEKTMCAQHGGKVRCPGAPGEDRCPRNNSITAGERDDGVRYIKDGVQYCCACYCRTWKDDELSRNAKKFMHAKEQAVREYLEQRFAKSHPQLKWVMDRQVDGTRRRPDHRPLIHLLGVKSHDLVIETDENSHWFYLCADEREKEADVHYWLNKKKKPLFFLRFNPDAYDDPATGERVTTCWGKDNFGLPRVKPSKTTEWAARLEKLAQIVETYLVDYTDTWAAWAEADRPKPELHTIELFYDDVALKKNAAMQALDAVKAAAKKRKAAVIDRDDDA